MMHTGFTEISYILQGKSLLQPDQMDGDQGHCMLPSCPSKP